MKSLTHYIQEKLLIKKNKNTRYKYFPQTKDELKEIIEKRIEKEGDKVDLNDIDVSQIMNMSNLFKYSDFNGDISKWDVSNVTNMMSMFYACKNFNKDISNWDVSNVRSMSYMFNNSEFNGDISDWDVSNVDWFNATFKNSSFSGDISKWQINFRAKGHMDSMFEHSPLEKNPPKWYYQW